MAGPRNIGRRMRTRSAGSLMLGVLLAVLVTGAMPVAGHGPRGARGGSQVTAASWSALGSNSGNGALSSGVNALAVSGADLYAGGGFTNAAGNTNADLIARWSGNAWSAMGGNGAIIGDVKAIAVSGSDVYVGGQFENVAGIPEADYVAKWNGTAWSALGGSGNGALGDWVRALAVSGGDLYVGGDFTDAAGIPAADHLAKWNGSGWSALASNSGGTAALNDAVRALAVSGSDLYVGGDFTNAGGVGEADFVARWSGSWSALGSGGSGVGAIGGTVRALAVAGTDIVAGGDFANAAGVPEADRVARWSGGGWSALGSNGAGVAALNSTVYALAVSGSDVYVGGAFTDGGGIATADNLARWNGIAWSALGSNGSGNGALSTWVYALAVSGTDLYAAGVFLNAAGIPTADYVAKWGQASAAVRQPDGRIRLGTGPFVGNDIYNATGKDQKRTGSAARGSTITFRLSVQNDGTGTDSFKLKATGAAASGYRVKYLDGTIDITGAVEAGNYATPSLAPGASRLITIKVKVKQGAAAGSRVTRVVTISSAADPTRRDAVKLVGKRA
jgi:hypothetical protein